MKEVPGIDRPRPLPAEVIAHKCYSVCSTDAHAKTCIRHRTQVTVETGAPTLAMHCGGKIKPRMALLQLSCMPAEQITCDVPCIKVSTCCVNVWSWRFDTLVPVPGGFTHTVVSVGLGSHASGVITCMWRTHPFSKMLQQQKRHELHEATHDQRIDDQCAIERRTRVSLCRRSDPRQSASLCQRRSCAKQERCATSVRRLVKHACAESDQLNDRLSSYPRQPIRHPPLPAARTAPVAKTTLGTARMLCTLQMPLSPFAEYANNAGGAGLDEVAWHGDRPRSLPTLSM